MIDAADIPRLMEENLAAHLAYMVGRYPGSPVRDGKDALLVDSGLHSDTFNKIARARVPGEKAGQLVRECLEHFRSVGRPFAWWLGPESGLGSLDAHLAAAGLAPVEEETGMALRLTALPQELSPLSGLSFARIKGEGDARTFAAIIAANWEPPDAEILRFYESVLPTLLDQGGPFRGWLALSGGRPVAAVEIFTTPGVAGVYSVSTLLEHRGRGIATRLLHAALAQSRSEGAELAVLQASPGALGLYKRLGFEETGRFEEWSLRP